MHPPPRAVIALEALFALVLVARIIRPAAPLFIEDAPPDPSSISVELAGRGVAHLAPEVAAARGLSDGDRLREDGAIDRMAPARIEALGVRIDPNEATIAELSTLPGVGAALAGRLAAGRPYRSIEDLARVPGVGKGRLSAFQRRLRFPAAAEDEGTSP